MEHLSLEDERLMLELQARIAAPSHQPLQQLHPAQAKRISFSLVAPGISLGQPLDKLPILRREQFLFVRGAVCQLDNLQQWPDAYAGARAEEVEMHGQRVENRLFGRR